MLEARCEADYFVELVNTGGAQLAECQSITAEKGRKRKKNGLFGIKKKWVKVNETRELSEENNDDEKNFLKKNDDKR